MLAASPADIQNASGYSGYQVIDELCVRAEANARRAGYVTVVVVGTEQAAGATTIAAAMAGRFRRDGQQRVARRRRPRRTTLSETFSAAASGGIPAMLARADEDEDYLSGRRSSDRSRLSRNPRCRPPTPMSHCSAEATRRGSTRCGAVTSRS
ncbi:MAG: hypothetical protein R2705_12470 [Ilumatobacteraceae bacterium]